MKLTKKKIGLIGMGFAVAAIAVLTTIVVCWLFAEVMSYLGGPSDTTLVAYLIFAFVALGCLYSAYFITLKR